MTFDYRPIVNSASALIKNFGKEYQLQSEDGKTTYGKIMCVMVERKKRKDEVTTGGMDAYISGDAKYKPETYMRLVVDNEVYIITGVNVLKPGATTVLYKASVSY